VVQEPAWTDPAGGQRPPFDLVDVCGSAGFFRMLLADDGSPAQWSAPDPGSPVADGAKHGGNNVTMPCRLAIEPGNTSTVFVATQMSGGPRLLEETDLPAVVDADALFGLELFSRSAHAPTVLTPHSGELARLLGTDSEWVDAHRLQALDRAVERFGCVVLLKGNDTLIGAPGQGPLVSGGWPALATAGTGDVLTGIIGAFLSKGVGARLAAAAGATAHAHAATAVEHPDGLVAGDVVEALPGVLHASL